MADTTGDGGRPALSAVVFGYHNEDTVLRAVRSLVEQDSDDPFEVIVATSGEDQTAARVRDAFPDVKVAESLTRLLPGGVRNLGASLATGDTIAFLEADCVARPGWVQHRIALHRAGHEAVASALDAMASYNTVDRASLYLVHPARLAGHPSGPAGEYRSYGLSFTRELLQRAGPFDATLRSYEDTAIAERVRALGVEPWFDPRVCIEHDGPRTLRHLVRDQFSRGRRESWAELLLLPAGRHRHRWEVAPGTRFLIVALRAVYRLAKRVRATAAAVRRGGSGPRGPGLLLPMALGLVAFQLGWAADQLRATRSANLGPPRDRLPAPRGFRRWVSTDGERVVALTFDGVPPAPWAEQILELLLSRGVPAAFFVTGEDAGERPEEIRAVAGAGHLVGTSGWSGAPFPAMPPDELVDELRRSCDLLRELTGRPVRHPRPPDGAYDWPVATALASLGLEMWLWTTHPTGPAPGASAQEQVRRTMDGLTPGAVLTVRVRNAEDAEQAVGAVGPIIDESRRRDYEFVSLGYVPPGGPGVEGDMPPSPASTGSS